MDEKVRMGKGAVECFVIDGEYNGKKIELLLVPLFNRGHGWVGPGYWQPKLEMKNMEPPSFKYNTRVYTKKELLAAGARPKYENLWMR